MKTPEKTYEEAGLLFQRRQYAEALKVLDEQGDGGYAHCVYARVRCLMKLERLDEARAECDRLRDQFGDERWEKLAEKIDAARKVDADDIPESDEMPELSDIVFSQRSRRRWLKVLAGAAAIGFAGAAIVGASVFREVLTGRDGGGLLKSAAALQTPSDDSAPSSSADAKADADPTEASAATASEATPEASQDPSGLQLKGVEGFVAASEREMLAAISSEKDAASAALEDAAAEKESPAEEEAERLTLAAAPSSAASAQQAQALSIIKPPKAHGKPGVYPMKSLPFSQVDSVLGLQQFKTSEKISNERGDSIILTNVNPNVGAWYLLDLNVKGVKNTLHLEVASLRGNPQLKPSLSLYRDGLRVTAPGEKSHLFPFWAPEGTPKDAPAVDSPVGDGVLNPNPVLEDSFKPRYNFDSPLNVICGGFVYLRYQKPGSATKLEIATDLLRETRIGDWLVESAKPYLIAEPEIGDDHRAASVTKHAPGETYPLDARIEESQADLYLTPPNLGIATDAADGRLYYGRWYRAANHPYVFVSMMKPTIVEKQLMDSYTDRVAPIGSHDKARRESDALVYLVAFDLSKFRFGYGLGADHPKLEWSKRAEKTKHTGKGPDGFDERSPFSSVGAVPPYYSKWVVGSFIAGFKREHGAFKTGPLSKINSCSHFGFMEQGVVFSRLLPGLATVAIGRDGGLNLFTWPEDGSTLLPQMAYGRQNCISIIEGVDSNNIGVPNPLVNDWGAGSWSGDQNGNVVTLRSSLAIQESNGGRFLLFAYFTGATPSTMARVFQAYQCNYAMLLDMNTSNYCYAALYARDADGNLTGAEYLQKDMQRGNGSDGSLKFLQKNDTRDFFYVLRDY
jgi:hypothetical protein